VAISEPRRECSDYSFVTTVPVQKKCFAYRILVGVFDSFLIAKLSRRAIDGLKSDVATVFCVVLQRAWVFFSNKIMKSRRTFMLGLTYRPFEFTYPILGKTVDWIPEETWCVSVGMLWPEEKLLKKGNFREVALAQLWSIKLFSKLSFYDFDDRKPHKFTNDKNCDKNIRKYQRNDRGLGLKRD